MISFVCLCVCGIGNITSELKNINQKPKLFFSRVSNMFYWINTSQTSLEGIDEREMGGVRMALIRRNKKRDEKKSPAIFNSRK